LLVTSELRCYRCGVELTALTPPLSRRDTCPSCRVDLRVCLMCTSFEPSAIRQCTEDDAEDVHDKTRANFCDYFSPNPAAYRAGRMTAQDRAEAELAALFGSSDDTQAPASPDDDTDALGDAEALFKP
jgi:hypothetical protein